MIRVSVNSAKCQGHARCLVHAPNIFAFDDERNQAYVLAPNPPDSELADLRRAVANCPEHAIAVISDRRTTESELKR